MISATHRRSLHDRRSQQGMTLIESLVAVAVLAISLVGIFAATMTGLRVSSTARLDARLATMVSGFAEVLKTVPYNECGSPVAYETAFEAADRGVITDGQEFGRLQGQLGAKFEVVEVRDAESDLVATCANTLSGVQKLTLKVTAVDVGNRARTAVITKRADEVEKPNQRVWIQTSNLRRAGGTWLVDPGLQDTYWRERGGSINRVALVGAADLSSGVAKVEWWCDASWAVTETVTDPPSTPPAFTRTADELYTGAPTADSESWEFSPVTAVDDARAECEYQSPANQSDYEVKYLAMRVTDTKGRIWTAQPVQIKLVPRVSGTSDPIPRITIVSGPMPCNSSVPCTEGDLATPFVFSGADSTTGGEQDPSPVRYATEVCKWAFGDGTFEEVAGPDCHKEQVTHEYLGGPGINQFFVVSLEIRNEKGFVGRTVRRIYINADEVVRPQPVIVATVRGYTGDQSSPHYVPEYRSTAESWGRVQGLAPELVALSASESVAGGDLDIIEYRWDFGDGSEPFYGPEIPRRIYSTGTTANNCPDNSRGMLLTLTVTSSNNATNTASMCMDLHPLSRAATVINPRARYMTCDDWVFTYRCGVTFFWDRIEHTPGAQPSDFHLRFLIESQGTLCRYHRDSIPPLANPNIDPNSDGSPHAYPIVLDRVLIADEGDCFLQMDITYYLREPDGTLIQTAYEQRIVVPWA